MLTWVALNLQQTQTQSAQINFVFMKESRSKIARLRSDSDHARRYKFRQIFCLASLVSQQALHPQPDFLQEREQALQDQLADKIQELQQLKVQQQHLEAKCSLLEKANALEQQSSNPATTLASQVLHSRRAPSVLTIAQPETALLCEVVPTVCAWT